MTSDYQRSIEVPLVSVITPSYNQRLFIEDNLRSVQNQDYGNIEHIVVDGGSSDGTVEVLKEYQERYNLKWVSEPDEGQADAINKGFTMSKGHIISWLNSDDAFLKRKTIAEVVGCFSEKPDADVLYGDAVSIDGSNNFRNVIGLRSFDRDYLEEDCFLIQPSVFFRRRVIDQFPLDKSLQYAMDYDLWLRSSESCKFEYVARVFSVDRNHPYRKVVFKKSEMIEESRQVSYRCYNRSLRVRIPLVLGYLERSIFKLPTSFRLIRKDEFAFDVKSNNLMTILLRHLLPFAP
jgi:glycosyltransferase involved in cell wall biosynthesis